MLNALTIATLYQDVIEFLNDSMVNCVPISRVLGSAPAFAKHFDLTSEEDSMGWLLPSYLTHSTNI